MRVVAEFMALRQEETVELPAAATGMDLLRSLNLAPDAHLLARGDISIPLDEPLRDGERLLVISVVSGGRRD